MPVKAYKISWLDSTRAESSIHIAMLDADHTLCGYSFGAAFKSIQPYEQAVWVAYRVGRTRSVCPTCVKLAQAAGLTWKAWHPLCPEREPYELPQSSIRKQKIMGIYRKPKLPLPPALS